MAYEFSEYLDTESGFDLNIVHTEEVHGHNKSPFVQIQEKNMHIAPDLARPQKMWGMYCFDSDVKKMTKNIARAWLQTYHKKYPPVIEEVVEQEEPLEVAATAAEEAVVEGDVVEKQEGMETEVVDLTAEKIEESEGVADSQEVEAQQNTLKEEASAPQDSQMAPPQVADPEQQISIEETIEELRKKYRQSQSNSK